MRHFVKILTFFVLLCILHACNSDQAPTVVDEQDTIPSMITQIQKCSRLYTTEYHIRKIVTHDDVLRLKGSVLKQDFDFALPLV